MIFHPLALAEYTAAMINVLELCFGFATIKRREEASIGSDGFFTAGASKVLLG